MHFLKLYYYLLQLSFKNTSSTDFELGLVYCTCPIGLSGACGHVIGALYQLAEYKKLGLKAIPEDVAKTSQPQTWHTPRGPKIQGKAVQDIQVSGYKKVVKPSEEAPRTVQSTLYNPIRGDGVTWDIESLKAVDANMLVIPALETTVQQVDCKYGKVKYGSVLSYQQKLESNCAMNIFDGVTFPDLPCNDVMENHLHTTLTEKQTTSRENLKLSITEASRFESQTRSQSQNPFWYKLRKNRITASKVGEIFKRKKEPTALINRLKSTRHVMTSAMKQGLASEPTAAAAYIKIKGNRVNLYPCGVVVNVWAPWLAASPDRKVYNPDMIPPFGLLEIKCPQVGSVLECPYLTKNVTGSLTLNRNHAYYYQVLAQLAVTGLEWCDLFIWCQNDYHKETLYFNRDPWQTVKNKIDQFYFNYFL